MIKSNAEYQKNRGIGEAIVRKLAKESRDRFILYATSRKGIDLGLETAPEMQVVYQRLDIADTSSIKNFVNLIQKEHRSVDVLVNNAGVNLDDNYSLENVKITLDTNVRGTLQVSHETVGAAIVAKLNHNLPQMCRAFIPLLSKNGRIVNVSSTGSSLNQYSTEIQQRFRSAKMTLQDVESMMQEYQVSTERLFIHSINHVAGSFPYIVRDVSMMVPKSKMAGRSSRTALAKHALML